MDGLVQIGFATAVGADDDVEGLQLQCQFADRAEADQADAVDGHGESRGAEGIVTSGGGAGSAFDYLVRY